MLVNLRLGEFLSMIPRLILVLQQQGRCRFAPWLFQMELTSLDQGWLLQARGVLRPSYMKVAILEVGVVLHHLLLLIGFFEQRAYVDVRVCIACRWLR